MVFWSLFVAVAAPVEVHEALQLPLPSPHAAPEVWEPTALQTAIVANARAWLGTPYVWEGRGDDSHPGLDCLGLLFRAHGDAVGRSWRTYPYDPSPLVKSGRLGAPVPGLDGVFREALHPELLQPGDVVYLLLADWNIGDEPLWEAAGVRYWPWHTVSIQVRSTSVRGGSRGERPLAGGAGDWSSAGVSGAEPLTHPTDMKIGLRSCEARTRRNCRPAAGG